MVALHACTEANTTAAAMAEQAGALWALMPCCMRTDANTYPVGCQLLHCADEVKYALLCGMIAARHR